MQGFQRLAEWPQVADAVIEAKLPIRQTGQFFSPPVERLGCQLHL